MRNSERTGNFSSFLALQTAVVLFGLSGVVGKGISVLPTTIAFGRVLFSSTILFILLKIKGIPLRAERTADAALGWMAGLLLAVHWISFFKSVQEATVAIGTLTYSTYPMFLLILEPILYREKLRLRNIFLVIALLIGVAITVPELSLSNNMTIGVFWGMLSSLTYALLTLCNRKLSRSYSSLRISFREQMATAVFVLPIFLLSHDTIDASSVLGIAAIGVFSSTIAFSLFVYAQKKLSSITVGISAGMESVYSILFAFLLLGEVPAVRELIGGAIILAVATLSLL